jgi:serine/threonine protein kinase
MMQLPNAQKLDIDHFAERFPYNNLHRVLPRLPQQGIELLNKFLTFDPKRRITAERAVDHPYFDEKPYPASSHLMPTFPTQHTMDGFRGHHRPLAANVAGGSGSAAKTAIAKQVRHIGDRFGSIFGEQQRKF